MINTKHFLLLSLFATVIFCKNLYAGLAGLVRFDSYKNPQETKKEVDVATSFNVLFSLFLVFAKKLSI